MERHGLHDFEINSLTGRSNLQISVLLQQAQRTFKAQGGHDLQVQSRDSAALYDKHRQD